MSERKLQYFLDGELKNADVNGPAKIDRLLEEPYMGEPYATSVIVNFSDGTVGEFMLEPKPEPVPEYRVQIRAPKIGERFFPLYEDGAGVPFIGTAPTTCLAEFRGVRAVIVEEVSK